MPTAIIDGQSVPIGPRPGDTFNLRDVDCYDESVGAARGLGVGYGLLSNTQCS
jgi:hypothetical protein